MRLRILRNVAGLDPDEPVKLRVMFGTGDAVSLRGYPLGGGIPAAGDTWVWNGTTFALTVSATQVGLDAHLADLLNPHVTTKAQVGLSAVENTKLSTWAGTVNITTVGTLTSGVWGATAIAATKGGTGLTSYVLGDVLYASAANVLSPLSGQVTTTRKFLRQLGTGTASAAPAWDTVTRSDVGLGLVENVALSTWAGTVNVTTVAEAAVTAHQAALALAWSQITSGVPLTFAPSAHTHGLADLTDYGADGGYIRSDSTGWKRVSGVAWGDLSGVPGTFTPAAHVHAWGDITSGVPATFAPSAHTHPASEITAGSFGSGNYTITGLLTFAGTPTAADNSIYVTAANGLTLRGSEGTTNQFAVVSRSSGTNLLVINKAGGEMTVTPDVTISGRLYIQSTTFASIIDRALQVGNAANTGTRLSVGVGNTDTATGAAARKVHVGGVLAAAANNDVLYGVEIAATVSVSAFTGTTFYGLKIGNVAGAATNYALHTGTGAVLFGGSLTASAGGSLTGTWTDLGAVTTVDINGGTVGGVTLDGTINGQPTWGSTQAMSISGTAALASTVTVVDSTSATCSVALFDAATGSLAAKTDAGLTYAATTGILTATGFAGALNGTVGATTPASGVFTTVWATSDIYGADGTAALPSIRLYSTPSGFYLSGSTGIGISANGVSAVYFDGGTQGATFSSTITAAGHIGLAATKKVYLDGVAMTGDTYIYEKSADTLVLVAGAAEQLTLTATGTTVAGSLVVGSTNAGDASVTLKNTNAGAGASNSLYFQNDTSTTQAYIQVSSGAGGNIADLVHTGAGLFKISQTALTGGLRLFTASTTITVYAAGILAATFSLADTALAGTATITGAFGCNTKAAQTAYASGGALAAYGTGAYGLDSDANMAALRTLVVNMRDALVANGIMS